MTGIALSVVLTSFCAALMLECVTKKTPFFIIIFFMCMFYQLLHVQHGCSSTQSWGNVVPSIVETRDQNSRGCPILFSNRNLGSFSA